MDMEDENGIDGVVANDEVEKAEGSRVGRDGARLEQQA